jgi:hypothetical protein
MQEWASQEGLNRIKHCQQKEVQIQRLDRLLDRLSGFGYKPDENNCILGLVK